MSTRWFSLRRRLLWLLLGGVSAAWLATMALSYADAHNEVDELFDAQLVQAAQTLLALTPEDIGNGVEDLGNITHKYQRQLRFQIWRADGKLLVHSRNAPKTPLVQDDGFSESSDANGHWRHYSQWNAAHTLQIQVSENHYFRDDLIGQIAWRLVLPALFGLPLIGLWVWIATRRGMSALLDLAGQIASRKPQQLQPLTQATAPEEIRPMLDALNELFARVAGALEAEQRFTADAAHELRTPLAALQAQLKVALRARDADERDRSLQQLQQGLARASHLVEQMLQLARLDPQSALPDPGPVALAPLCEAACADLGPLILDKQLDFSLQAQAGLTVHGQADWIGILVRNLIDNAVRYTPRSGKVWVQTAATPAGVCLDVCDSGPGIPVAERETVLRRFYRLAPAGNGSNDHSSSGSGLGLAIAARIAQLHGARLLLDDGPEGRGLCISVIWPPA